MRERVYYRIGLELKSALSIGAADSTQTDNDVILDSRGLPLLPATSLAGMYRSQFDEVRALEVFGEIIGDEKDSVLKGLPGGERLRILGPDGHRCDQSAVRVYDGTWIAGNNTVAVRDGVALRDKVAIDGLKFDRQAVQAGAQFVTYIEIDDTSRCTCSEIESVIGALHSGAIRLGSKSTRGFGRFEVNSCLRRQFSSQDVREWLDFDMFAPVDSPSWATADDLTGRISGEAPAQGLKMRLELELRGGISIREYTTEPGDEDAPNEDYSQMIVHGRLAKDQYGEDVPVIPGTSWAGAFRSRYERFAGAKATQSLFGYVSTDGSESTGRKSSVTFDESTLAEGQWQLFTRNSIDRFTAKTIDGALYTERTYYGGKTSLTISVADFEQKDDRSLAPLICAIADLHNGLLPVGGLTSVGRGLFKIVGAHAFVAGKEVEGFEQALLAKNPCCANDTDDFIEPEISAIVSMLCGEGR